MEARSVEGHHVELTFDDSRSCLTLSGEFIGIGILVPEENSFLAEKSYWLACQQLERPHVLISAIGSLEELRDFDQQRALREFRQRLLLLVPLLDQRFVGFDPAEEGDIVKLLAVERPRFGVLADLLAKAIPIPLWSDRDT